ncbi:MAG: 2-C-methyl-D-erythritol 4-phosphate cytidylyltransferase, partial [bacterium]
MSDNYAIIVAAGAGTRLPGAVAKQFRPLAEKPLLAWTLAAFDNAYGDAISFADR